MRTYTVKQAAEMSGVSVRALHHYDRIGLLTPACIGENGYRYYGREELLRLQQILIHRELGIPLRRIAELLDSPGFDRLAALRDQRGRLAAEAARYAELVETIDRTIARLNGEQTMQDSDLYKGVSPGKQVEYEDWLIDNHGEGMKDAITRSKAAMADWTPGDHAAAMAELAEAEQALAEAMRRGAATDSPELGPLLERHRAWVSRMWGRPCPPEAYAGLADLYLSHPDFVARYEAIETGFAEYLAGAMKYWAARQAAADDLGLTI